MSLGNVLKKIDTLGLSNEQCLSVTEIVFEAIEAATIKLNAEYVKQFFEMVKALDSKIFAHIESEQEEERKG